MLVALVDIGIITNCSDGAGRNFGLGRHSPQTSGMSCLTINLHPQTLTLQYAQLITDPSHSTRPHSEFRHTFRNISPEKSQTNSLSLSKVVCGKMMAEQITRRSDSFFISAPHTSLCVGVEGQTVFHHEKLLRLHFFARMGIN